MERSLLKPIQKNIFENPGWYITYNTLYQAKVFHGRLEVLLNFQTLTSDIKGFSISNASFLNEATANAEAIYMLNESRSKDQIQFNKFFIF